MNRFRAKSVRTFSILGVALVIAANLVIQTLEQSSAAPTSTTVPSNVETQPVAASGDAADDPAIWVDTANPGRSLVIGNSKKDALESYDLAGKRVQRTTSAPFFYGNVDVRGNLVAVSHKAIQLFTVNPSTRQLTNANEANKAIATSGEGLCLYDTGRTGPADGLFAFTVTRDVGRVRQYELLDSDGDGLLTGVLRRDITVGTEAEACVADDAGGSLFISEEDVAVWRYGANASAGAARTKVAAVNASSLPADLEGLALGGGHLIVSAQNTAHPNQNMISVHSAQPPYSLLRSVRVGDGARSDDCDQTDGLTAYSGSLGSAFPDGLLVCQDGYNDAPGTSGNQNFKYADLRQVLGGY